MSLYLQIGDTLYDLNRTLHSHSCEEMTVIWGKEGGLFAFSLHSSKEDVTLIIKRSLKRLTLKCM